MKKIAVIQFPGLNSEYETKRAVDDAGMEGVIYRWNDDPIALAEFDGFIIPGGFAYEDRGRAGLIPSLHPVMDVIRGEVAKGKPLLGICNGAQVVVETCMVPGSGKLELCLANNKMVRNDELVGTGFINYDVDLKATAEKGRCAFNLTTEKDSLHSAPIAHGEGRFTTNNKEILSQIISDNQIVFKYCNADGNIDKNYPINPNGAMENAAAICNKAGNVMAIMPHPERAYSAPIPEIFESMRIYLEEYYDQDKAMIPETSSANKSSYSLGSLPKYTHPKLEILVDLIITDNTAQTFTNTLNHMGFEVNVRRQTHYTIDYADNTDPTALAIELIKSGELLNVNKEIATVIVGGNAYKYNPDQGQLLPIDAQLGENAFKFYVKDHEDSFGRSKTENISKHQNIPGFKSVDQGVLWSVHYLDATVQEDEAKRENLNHMLQTNIFANPHSQELYIYS